jgi:uncharacterized repeat protein (TIGR01451 family)
MGLNSSRYRSVAFLIIIQLVISLIFPISISAAAEMSASSNADNGELGAAQLILPWPDGLRLVDRNDSSFHQPRAFLQAEAEPTTLEVQIVSSPYAVMDANDPTGIDGPVPQVFLVEAVITNTGTAPAEELVVSLDYNETGDWTLLPGENPTRSFDVLESGDGKHAYWFARFPLVNNSPHVYTVTAQALNALPVTVSSNFYANPGDPTVKVLGAKNTGNLTVLKAFKTSSEFILGSTFTATVDYNLPNKPSDLVFSPVGVPDFAPDSYRLISSTTRLYNNVGDQSVLIPDRLYFNALPDFAENAEVSYTFFIYGTKASNLCPYTAGDNSPSGPKYNNDYCQETSGTIIPVEGTLNLELSQEASSPVIQQPQVLTYTLHYTNTGTLPLNDIWIWDIVDPDAGDIIPTSINPPADSGETTSQLVAWYFDTIPIEGNVGSNGELQFSVLVDGHGLPLSDGEALVNHAYIGAGVDGLPSEPAYTSTLTTDVQAPSIDFNKSDGLLYTEPGDPLTYTLTLGNSGSVPAYGLVISDVLPAELSIAGDITPAPDQPDSQPLVWTVLDPLAPGSTLEIKIPVVSAIDTPDGTVLTNTATVAYQNALGFQYDPFETRDTTEVWGPVLSVEKSATPDPAIAGAMLTYTLDISNDGPGAASNVIVTDTLPENTTYLSCTGGDSCFESAGVVQWNLSSLPGNSDTSVDFQVQVSDSLTTGSELLNEDYWVTSDQTGPISGPALTTQVNREAAFVQGYVFEDLNLNGVLDAGESGIEGLAVTLPEALDSPQTTDSNGFYEFRVETQVPVSVSIGSPVGYTHTTPETVFLPELVFGETSEVNFGLVTGTPENGVVFGTVFNDANHDGGMDLGEQGISGVTVSSPGALTSPVTTNDLGQYTLQFESGGPATIMQTDLTGYVSTTPNVVNVNTSPSTSQQVDFADFLGIEIRGRVFNDINANGVNDAEPGLPGALVSAGDDSFVTPASGQYSLFVTVPDSSPLLVNETDPSGYISTAALPGAGASFVDVNTLSIDSPHAGTVYTGNNFGDTLPVDLEVSKQASSATLAAGMTLTYTLNYSNLSAADALGVTLTDTLPDVVVYNGIVEQDPELPPPAVDGQVLTWSIGELPAATSGSLSFRVLVKPDAAGSFTNFVGIAGTLPETDLTNNQDSVVTAIGVPGAATVYGTVYEDVNGNGVQDTGELGLAGVTLTLDGTSSTTSDQDGGYYFVVSTSGVHRVVESTPAGYFSTTPDEVHVNVVLGNSYPVNFGDAANDSAFVTIWGTVFNDANGNSVWDAGESGLPGVTITRDGVEPVTTNVYGGFTFVITSEGLRTLVESDPSGYFSTTPNQVVVDTVLGHQYQVNFGDTSVSPCQRDSYEPDDEYPLAASLNVGVENLQQHNFCDDSVDWLVFTAQTGGVYTITATASGQRAQPLLTLYDDDLTPLASGSDSDPGMGYSARLVWQAPAAGVYYLQSHNNADLIASDTEYQIWMEEYLAPEKTGYTIRLPLIPNGSYAATGLSAPTLLHRVRMEH